MNFGTCLPDVDLVICAALIKIMINFLTAFSLLWSIRFILTLNWADYATHVYYCQ